MANNYDNYKSAPHGKQGPQKPKPIKSPYNFVPLNKQVYIPDWWDKVSHDIPFEDGIDGSIEVTWKNISPLFVRDASMGNGEFSMHIADQKGTRRYFIPGASLKGMLRSVISILSFGKMEQYENQYFGHRDFDTKLPEGRKYAKNMKNIKFGWLEKQPDETFVLYPCKGEYRKIKISEVAELFGDDYSSSGNVWETNYRLRDNNTLFPYISFDDDDTEYRLFCTGKINGKKHELLIPEDTQEGIALNDKIIESFLTVYAPTPGFENFVSYLDKGERIPVSFISEKGTTNIIAIGMGRMLRYPYKQDINTLVNKEQGNPQKEYDLCETMFGQIDNQDNQDNQNSLKGRVQIGNAMIQGTVSDNELLRAGGVLGEPKASFYPLYLKQDSHDEYRTYENAKGIAGRKRYRIHQGGTVVNLPQGNGNINVMTRFRPIPRNQTFKMRINIHNLKPVELGALLLAIKLKQGAFHNIGMAKAYGYGKLISENIELNLRGEEQHSVDHYINLFKSTMEAFTNNKWSNSDVITSLLGIMGEHSNDEMFVNESGKYRVMSLKEYKEFKKNSNFSKLTEKTNGKL